MGARFKSMFSSHASNNMGKIAIVSGNKRLTHDLFVMRGYHHLVPRQAFFPRVYDPSLASRIAEELELSNDDLVILKLLNRSRGAGVLPIPMSELDHTLREILNPPVDIENWLEQKLKIEASSWQQLAWGSYEEQTRHWWSN